MKPTDIVKLFDIMFEQEKENPNASCYYNGVTPGFIVKFANAILNEKMGEEK